MGNTLGSRIRYLREEHHLSQKGLAEKLNLTNVQLSRYESGDRKPDPEMITNIAGFFNVSTDFLLGLTSSINEYPAIYLGQQDAELLKRIKETPEMEPFIKDVLDNHNYFHKLKDIWKIIKPDNS